MVFCQENIREGERGGKVGRFRGGRGWGKGKGLSFFCLGGGGGEASFLEVEGGLGGEFLCFPLAWVFAGGRGH